MADEELDPVLVSVAAYSTDPDAYAAHYGGRYDDRVERFAAALPSPSLILDAGCGPGHDLARFHELGHTVRGIDLNPDFVARARAHAPTWCVDLRQVGSSFPAGTFDGIWANSSLVHLGHGEVVSVLGQFAMLLVPGGRLYACVTATGSTGWRDEPDGRRWYTVWEPDRFAAAVAAAGLTVEHVDRGPVVEVWATKDGGPAQSTQSLSV